MERLERLLDLVHVLQSAREPVPLSTLKEVFPDYSEGSDDAVRRKFERDKAQLARIGLVLRYQDDEDGGTGYSLDIDASYLPDFVMDESERALLSTAARAALADPGFPHRASLRLALAKLGAEPSDGASSVTISHGASRSGAAASVEALGEALAARKRVFLRHRKPGAKPTEREVDPYGLFLKAGAWYLVGLDHLSGEQRIFELRRVEELTINTKKPGTPDFSVPEDFELEPLLSVSPSHFRVHEPVRVAIRVDDEIAFLMKDWGEATDGVFEFETSNLQHIIDQVLSLGRRAELLSPPSARERVIDALRAILRTHDALTSGTP
ncbi:MAG: helix-turn-helix transcriptional regulator [Polyangiales bacterium]